MVNSIRKLVALTGRASLYLNPVGFDKERRITYGLCKGSADLVGWAFRTGRFLAFEVKTGTGRPSEEQQLFLDHVNRTGGIGRVIRCGEDALRALDDAESTYVRTAA